MKITALVVFAVLACTSFAQPLVRSFPFTMLSADTARSSDLPWGGDEAAGARGRIAVSSDGHFVAPDGTRLRLFGTELMWTSQFISSDDARKLARRFKKLGINAVRLNYNDYPYYDDGNLISYNPQSSITPNPINFARLDTLLHEFKQAGIYTIFTLNYSHYYFPNDGVAWTDSMHGSSLWVQYIDARASQLQREWAKVVLGHTNALTGQRYGDDPAILGVEFNGNLTLSAAWRYNYLNYIDSNNVLNKGASTISWHRSRRLDTLYSEYLLRKYGSDAGINNAWRGGAISNPPNLIENGSFETIGQGEWSFVAANGATGTTSLFSPAKDSEVCMWIAITGLGPNPAAGNVYLLNFTPRCGKDTLYNLHFWAKVRYSAQRPTLARQIYVAVSPYQGGAGALGEYVSIDTTWKEFTLPFRATQSGLQYVIFYLGAEMGDVLFDGVTVKRREELGLIGGESASNRTIGRTPYSRIAMLPYQRVRDMSLFYDSLETDFYSKMKRAIRDTIKSTVLVNVFPSSYWSSALEPYLNRTSDFTECYVNTDYVYQRDGTVFSDSTWRMINTSPLRDAGAYLYGLAASQSVEGKPFIVNLYNPTMNQHYASMLPQVAAYAALQDWDGLFITRYALYREGLFADLMFPAIGYYSWYDIAGNPSIIGQFPAMSELFRTARFDTAANYAPILHNKDDVQLMPTFADYRHPFNVEGYLDPNIVTSLKVRQRYNSPTRKVAAEYPFVSDTSAKRSDNNELYWSQSSGHFVGIGKTAASIGGIFGEDTLKLGGFAMRRLDKLGDAIALTLISKDPGTPLGSSQLTHLTIAARGQNTGMVWVDSVGFGKNWGTAPTVMSAPSLEFFLKTDSSRVIVHTLDETGNRVRQQDAIEVAGVEPKRFKFTLDLAETNSMWYTIEQTNAVNAVRRENGRADKFDIAIYPNPVSVSSVVHVDIADDASVQLALYDPLGREVLRLADERLEAGKYSYDLDVTALPAGRYLLAGHLGVTRVVRSVSVVK